MRHRSVFLLAALVALILIGVWSFLPRFHLLPLSGGPAQPSASGRGTTSRPALTAPAPLGHPAGEEPSHLADDLNSPSGDIHADLRIVNEIFRQYRSSTHGANPVGENAEVIRVLAGRNALEFAFIPPNHPAINAKGELCDRWGTPFFFHALSGVQMEIRSAGPDRIMWTADDDVLTPGLSRPRL